MFTTMLTSYSLIFLALAFPHIEVTEAAAAISNIVQCSPIVVDMEESFDVCWLGEYISPAMGYNETTGETFPFGGYNYKYVITKGLMEGDDGSDPNDHAGIVINWIMDNPVGEQCNVTVTLDGGDGMTCTSCVYCGNDRVTADCKNIPHGRYVDCEAVAWDGIFFPLTAESLMSSMGDDTIVTISVNVTDDELPTMTESEGPEDTNPGQDNVATISVNLTDPQPGAEEDITSDGINGTTYETADAAIGTSSSGPLMFPSMMSILAIALFSFISFAM